MVRFAYVSVGLALALHHPPPGGRVGDRNRAGLDTGRINIRPSCRGRFPDRLESTGGLLRDLAVTGGSGLVTAREQRTAAIEAAEQFGDPLLTGRVIGAYDVPALWPCSDDPVQAAAIVAAAERALTELPPTGHDATRARQRQRR